MVFARLVTVAMVIGLCAFAVARGWTTVAFATASSGASDQQSNLPDAWFNAAPVAAMALDTALDETADANGFAAVKRRIALLTELLSHRPLSSEAWLSLADGRLLSGTPYKDVLAALKMSSLTGPNEARLMWRRGMFSLQQWESLPAEFQRQAARDLAGPVGAGFLDDDNIRQIKSVLDRKPAETQTQIAALLRAEGLDAKSLAQIGLDAAKATP
jgi:aminopeptidase N